MFYVDERLLNSVRLTLLPWLCLQMSSHRIWNIAGKHHSSITVAASIVMRSEHVIAQSGSDGSIVLFEAIVKSPCGRPHSAMLTRKDILPDIAGERSKSKLLS